MDLYENMPDNLIGKLLKRKNVVDFMDFTPACLSLIAVVSNKKKNLRTFGCFKKRVCLKKNYC